MRSARWILGLAAGVLILVIAVALVVASKSDSGSVRRINREDPRLIQAIKTARAGLPEFLKELKSPKAGQRFAVMGTFKTPEGDEYLWMKDPTVLDGKLSGTLDQIPMFAPVHKGDVVSIDRAGVVDWFIRDGDGTLRGRFTEGKQ